MCGRGIRLWKADWNRFELGRIVFFRPLHGFGDRLHNLADQLQPFKVCYRELLVDKSSHGWLSERLPLAYLSSKPFWCWVWVWGVVYVLVPPTVPAKTMRTMFVARV